MQGYRLLQAIQFSRKGAGKIRPRFRYSSRDEQSRAYHFRRTGVVASRRRRVRASTLSTQSMCIRALTLQPLDSLLTLYAKCTNAIQKSENVAIPSVEAFNTLVAELTAVKEELATWRQNLPPYYESIPVPNDPTEVFDFMDLYPYSERYDYMTSTCFFAAGSDFAGFVGHTMNMYRAIIMNIDRHLLSHMYPDRGPSEQELLYLCPKLSSLLTSFADLGKRLLCRCRRSRQGEFSCFIRPCGLPKSCNSLKRNTSWRCSA